MEDQAMARTFERQVGDKAIKVTLDPEDLKMGRNLVKEANKIAASIGLVGELMADVTQELHTLDGEYRSWRAQAYRAVIKRDTKVAEWRARQAVESQPEFLRFKELIAGSEGDLAFLRQYHDALRVKSSMIRARAELQRIEHQATTQ
jgi:hypothetical protein